MGSVVGSGGAAGAVERVEFEAPDLEPEELIARGAEALRGFVQIPAAVLLDRRLSAWEVRVYATLRRYARQGESCWPGQDALAAELGITPRALRKHLAGLKAAGYIDWRRRFATSNVYVIRRIPAAQLGTGVPQQSGTPVPHSQERPFLTVRNACSSRSGTPVPHIEVEAEKNTQREVDAEEVPPSGALPPFGQERAPAASPPTAPEGERTLFPLPARDEAPPLGFADPPRAKRRRRRESTGEGQWVREFSAAHKARCGGELPNFGEAGKLLKPLRIEHGHERLLAAWQAYLAATPTQWVTVRQFAAKPAQWLARACASSTKDPATMTAKERLMAKYGGGCAA